MIKVFTAFAGYDSQLMALDRLGINYDCVGWSEIDRFAIKAHNAMYPQYADRNYGNICTIDWHNVPDFDLFTYSFPCTDISSGGRQRGLDQSSGTRSSLLWECEKAIRIKRPKYLLMENVKALVGKKFKPYFLEWEQLLVGLGYNNYSKVLNSKDYGVPQSRERIFMISILESQSQSPYFFPKSLKLDKCMRDVLERNVDKRYYLSDKLIQGFLLKNEINKRKGNGFKFDPVDINNPSKTILTSGGDRTNDNFIKIEQIGNLVEGSNFENPHRGRVFNVKGLSPTIDTRGGGRGVKILQKSRGYNKGGEKDICPTITGNSFECNNYVKQQKIRKLTPRECFRFMGVSENNINILLQSGISNTQLYKMAGNSIVVDVLYYIFRKLFIEINSETPQLQLF